MNKRMIELYQEASEFAYKICREEGREGGTSDHIWNTLSTGRFAELIVWECIKLAVPEDSYRDEWFKAKCDVMDRIKQHFGVNDEKPN